MAEIAVSSNAELQPAFTRAKPGDAIVLAAGDYAHLGIANRKYAPPGIVIRPARGARVTIAGIITDGVYGIKLQDVVIATDGIGLQAMRGERIYVERVEFHGDLNGELESKTSTAVLFRDCTDCGVRDSLVHHTGAGIAHQSCNGVEIINNTIHTFRFDGIRGGSTNVRIERNEIWDMYPAPADHPDGIQFWTSQLTQTPENIVIRRNRVMRKAGKPFQGIFVADEGQVGIHGLDIEENLVLSDHYHGISVYHATSPKIIGNYVGTHEGAGLRSWIKVEGCTDPEVRDNLCAGALVVGGSSRLPPSTNVQNINNRLIKLAPPGDDREAEAWWVRLTGQQPKVSRAEPAAGTGLPLALLAAPAILAQKPDRRTALGQLAALVTRWFTGSV